MRLKALWSWSFGGSWTKMASALLTLVLLVPVPALAFIFNDPAWTFSGPNRQGFQVRAPAVITNVGTTDFVGGGLLQLDMGFNGPNPGASDTSGYSVINATRSISVGAGGENVQVSKSFETLLQGASMRVLVSIIQSNGNPVPVGSPIALRSGIKFVHVFNQVNPVADTVRLGQGNYTIAVKIEYRKNRLGVWDNSAPRPGSPHTFVFKSV